MDWLSFVTFFMPLNVNDTDDEDGKPGQDVCQSKSIARNRSGGDRFQICPQSMVRSVP